MTHTEHALYLFPNNSNCSQSVATPFAPLLGLDHDTLHKMCTGFGAGIAYRQQVCGAVSGGVLVISGLFGNPVGRDFEKKNAAYEEVQKFLAFMEDRHSDIRCEKIIGRTLKTSDEWAKAREDGLFDTVCSNAVASAAEYLHTLAASSLERFLSVAPASPDELGDILSVQHKAFAAVAERFSNPLPPPCTETLEQLQGVFPSIILLTAKWNGRIVGSVRVRVDGGTGHVGRLSVLPAFQGLGIGRALIRLAEKATGPVRRFEIFTAASEAGAINIYESEGYRRFRTGTDAAGIDVVYLEKK
ncbi:MAG: GNAT family N-acetyltransferase [Spirochaetales bacterium]|nr:GNAT family N-acetyltransferase [Spirochaetales bacterium]